MGWLWLLVCLETARAATTGRIGCWFTSYDYERCCNSKDPEKKWVCFDVEAGITRELCCFYDDDLSGEPWSNESDYVRPYIIARRAMHTNLRHMVKTASCLVDGVAEASSCERDYLRAIGRLSYSRLATRRWMREHGPALKLGQRAGSRVEALFLAANLMEQVLYWLVCRWLVLTESVVKPSKALKIHTRAMDELRSLFRTAAEQRWKELLAPTGSCVAKVPAPLHREPVHIGLVASVGQPPYGAKALAGIRSALAFARRAPLHFHLFVDSEGAEDMEHALASLEPELRCRGRFEMHGQDVINRFLKRLRRMVPPSCSGGAHFGDVGWVRLFVHEVFEDRPEISHLIFVDAGDFVFLEDPAAVLEHRDEFKDEQVIAAPIGGEKPFQFFDLHRMRRAGWTKIMEEAFEEHYKTSGDAFCWLGEGEMVDTLKYANKTRHLFHEMPSAWSFEPWEHKYGHGIKDIWADPAVWKLRLHPGLRDWTRVAVYCDSFLEAFTRSFQSRLPPSRSEQVMAAHVAMMLQWYLGREKAMTDEKGQLVTCGEPVKGMHFVYNMKGLPWVHEFLNFWAGLPAWGGDKEEWKRRSLRTAGALPSLPPGAAKEGLLLIGAGWARTGTQSLVAALKRLGLAAYHGKNAYEDQALWCNWLLKGNANSLDQAVNTITLKGYNATLDKPMCFLYRSLLERFPKAKVLLTVRDSAEEWYQSNRKLFQRIRGDDCEAEMHRLEGCHFDLPQSQERRSACIEGYRRHIADVKASVPQEQLLVYNVKEGWGPLCKFLGVPVPRGRFPHIDRFL